jgi:DNA (cytosine-5)-methyltransferase 1
MKKIVDLFCGCGGFGLGAKQAGFEVVMAVDIDKTLQSAYERNFPNTKVVNGDLSKMEGKEWCDLLGDQEIDGVIGGPPCQGYSRMGKGDINDPRRSLLGHFFKTINIISPKFFVMENVEGLLDKKNAQELFDAIKMADKKYTVLAPIVVDASKFGAPTKRKRVVVIGYDPLRVNEISTDEILCIDNEAVTVKDAIKDIGEPICQQKDSMNFGWAQYRSVKTLSTYAVKMRASPKRGLGWSLANENLKRGHISGNFDTIHSPEVMARYGSITPGQTDPVSRSKRLAWNGFCPTLRAGTGADKGSHQAVRPLHPQMPRVITVREAARLQGFPDWFCFHNTKWHSFRMIGNSVSPLVSEAILNLIFQKISDTVSDKLTTQ